MRAQIVCIMERWANRVAVVTGASSGIGAAIVKYLANNGLITVGLAPCTKEILALRNDVKPNVRERIHGLECDVRNEQEVVTVFKKIVDSFGPVAVLANNAGIARLQQTLLQPDNTQDMRDIIDTNVMGVVYCTREAFRSMKTLEAGHVFLTNSICGHTVFQIPNTSLNMYPPSKFAITAMTEVYRQEFLNQNTKIKVTSISPGMVDTNIHPDRDVIAKNAHLKADDIADALIYCLQTPPHVQIHELTIKPLGEWITK